MLYIGFIYQCLSVLASWTYVPISRLWSLFIFEFALFLSTLCTFYGYFSDYIFLNFVFFAVFYSFIAIFYLYFSIYIFLNFDFFAVFYSFIAIFLDFFDGLILEPDPIPSSSQYIYDFNSISGSYTHLTPHINFAPC